MKKINTKVLIGIILAIGFLVYINALPNGFVWDDEEQIVKNLVIRDWSNFNLIFTSSTFNSGGAGLTGGFYRPLVSLFYTFNYHIFGLIPFGFRFSQLVLHLFNLVLIFFVIKKILDAQKINFGREIAFLSTILFAVHPINVESVVYIASIGEILYSLFLLLAILFFLKERICFAFLFSFLGLLSKETAIIIFPLLAVYCFLFLKPKLKHWLKYLLYSIITLGSYFSLRILIAKISTIYHHVAPISNASFLERIQTIPHEIFSYFKLLFFPKDLTISHHFVVNSFSDIRFWGSLIFILLLLSFFGFILYKTKNKIIAFFGFWFLISLAPALNIIPLEMTITERWMYFPLIGFLVIFSYLVLSLKQSLGSIWKKIIIIFLTIIIISLFCRTVFRNENWKNGLTLYGHDILLSKNNYDIENNYGTELFRTGNIDEAGKHFQNSIDSQPNWTYPHNNLGVVLENQGQLDKALTEYETAISISDYYLAYQNKGGILLKMKEYDKAKTFLIEALNKFPHNPILKYQLAIIYLKENDKNSATQLLLQANQEDPISNQIIQLLNAIQKGIKIEI